MKAERVRQIAALKDELANTKALQEQEVALLKGGYEAAVKEAMAMANSERLQVSQMVSQMIEESKQQVSEVCEESRVEKGRLAEEINQLKAFHSSETCLLESTHREDLAQVLHELHVHLFMLQSHHQANEP